MQPNETAPTPQPPRRGEGAEAPAAEVVTAGRARTLMALARWGFPMVGLATTLASQILLPRILQLRLSEGEYVSYIAVTSLAAYLGLADGGFLVSILRELSAHHGAGNRALFAGEARRARRVFAVVALVSCAVAAVAIGSTLATAEAAWSGADDASFRASVVEVLLATGLLVGIGSFHTTLQFSTGRLLSGQLVAVANTLIPLVPLVVALYATRDLAAGLHSFAAGQLLVAAGRAWSAHRLLREETFGVLPARPPRRLIELVTSGVALKAADVLPASAYPHMLSMHGAGLVPTAVPARTYANACRLVPQQFLNLLQVHITRRMAGAADARARGTREYRAAASSLCAMQLLAMGTAGLCAVPVFRLWLPGSEADVQKFLPGMFVEQALLSASMPAAILFTATGRLRTLGFVRLGGVALGLVAFLVTLRFWPTASFGVGFAVSALPIFAFSAYAELHGLPGFPPHSTRDSARYAVAVAAAVACVLYGEEPVLASIATAVGAAMLLPGSVRDLRTLFRDLRLKQLASDVTGDIAREESELRRA